MNDTTIKIVRLRRLMNSFRNEAAFKRDMSGQIDAAQQRLEHLDSGHRDMIRAHLEFLDHLTQESRRGLEDATADIDVRDYRLEFMTWYLQHRPEKKLR